MFLCGRKWPAGGSFNNGHFVFAGDGHGPTLRTPARLRHLPGQQTTGDRSRANPLLHHFLTEALVDYDDDYDAADLIGKYLTTKNRPIRMNLNFADGVSSDVLLPQRIDGVEAICDGIEMRIYCVALDATLALKTLIGLPVEVQLVTDQGNLRRICGIVAEASQGESDGGLATYQLVMRDALAILVGADPILTHRADRKMTQGGALRF